MQAVLSAAAPSAVGRQDAAPSKSRIEPSCCGACAGRLVELVAELSSAARLLPRCASAAAELTSLPCRGGAVTAPELRCSGEAPAVGSSAFGRSASSKCCPRLSWKCCRAADRAAESQTGAQAAASLVVLSGWLSVAADGQTAGPLSKLTGPAGVAGRHKCQLHRALQLIVH